MIMIKITISTLSPGIVTPVEMSTKPSLLLTPSHYTFMLLSPFRLVAINFNSKTRYKCIEFMKNGFEKFLKRIILTFF
jgi:hypothetical protein